MIQMMWSRAMHAMEKELLLKNSRLLLVSISSFRAHAINVMAEGRFLNQNAMFAREQKYLHNLKIKDYNWNR